MEIAEWYVPLSVVTMEVDYTDVTVQVCVCVSGRPRRYTFAFFFIF